MTNIQYFVIRTEENIWMQLTGEKRLEFDMNTNLENSYSEETDVEEKMLIKRRRSYFLFPINYPIYMGLNKLKNPL